VGWMPRWRSRPATEAGRRTGPPHSSDPRGPARPACLRRCQSAAGSQKRANSGALHVPLVDVSNPRGPLERWPKGPRALQRDAGVLERSGRLIILRSCRERPAHPRSEDAANRNGDRPLTVRQRTAAARAADRPDRQRLAGFWSLPSDGPFPRNQEVAEERPLTGASPVPAVHGVFGLRTAMLSQTRATGRPVGRRHFRRRTAIHVKLKAARATSQRHVTVRADVDLLLRCGYQRRKVTWLGRTADYRAYVCSRQHSQLSLLPPGKLRSLSRV
jgi:hypothetical protein